MSGRKGNGMDSIDADFTAAQNRAVLRSRMVDEPCRAVLAHISGALDGENSALFLEAARKLIDFGAEEGASELIIDMDGLTYASSAGMGILMSILTIARSSGLSVRLVHMGEKVYSVIRLLGFDSFFTIG